MIWGSVVAKSGKKSTVNAAGNYTKPSMRKRLVASVKAGGKGGARTMERPESPDGRKAIQSKRWGL